MVKLARKPPADGSPPGKKEKEKAKDKDKDKDREKEKEVKPTASKKVWIWIWIWISILFTMVYLTKNSWKEILRASLPLTLLQIAFLGWDVRSKLWSNHPFLILNVHTIYYGGVFTLQKESRHLEVKDSEPKEEQERPRKQYPLLTVTL